MYQVVVRLDEKNINPYPDSNDKVYFVKSKHLRNFLLAFIKLHHTPGINPYNGNVTAKLSYLSICKFRLSEGYWWTSPTLGDEEKTSFYEINQIGSHQLEDKKNIIYMNALIHREYIKRIIERELSYSEYYSCSEHYSPCTSFVSSQFSEYFDLSKDVTIHFDIKGYLSELEEENVYVGDVKRNKYEINKDD